MKILLTGTEGWAIDRTARELRGLGHDILLCHDDGSPPFPCLGLTHDAECPTHVPADVVLTVRAHPLPQPTRRELAVTCALHHDIPLVVAGSTVLNPFKAMATLVVEGYDDLDGACREAVATRPVGVSD